MTDMLDAFRRVARYAVEDGISPRRLRRIVAEEYVRCGASPWAEWTREESLIAVRDWVAEHGRAPMAREGARANGLPSEGAARRVFGSWNRMLKAAGVEPGRRSPAFAYTPVARDLAA